MKKQEQKTVLSPAQQRVLDCLRGGIEVADVLLLKSRPGCGRSAILEQFHHAAGGVLLGVRDFMQSLTAHNSNAIEEAFLQMVEQALAQHDLVIVDDLHLVTQAISSCDYPRAWMLDAALTAILGDAAANHKKLVFGTDDEAPWPLTRRASVWEIREFEVEDFACIYA